MQSQALSSKKQSPDPLLLDSMIASNHRIKSVPWNKEPSFCSTVLKKVAANLKEPTLEFTTVQINSDDEDLLILPSKQPLNGGLAFLQGTQVGTIERNTQLKNPGYGCQNNDIQIKIKDDFIDSPKQRSVFYPVHDDGADFAEPAKNLTRVAQLRQPKVYMIFNTELLIPSKVTVQKAYKNSIQFDLAAKTTTELIISDSMLILKGGLIYREELHFDRVKSVSVTLVLL